MIPIDTMNRQINLRLPAELLASAASYADKHGYGNLQEFIKESIREKVVDRKIGISEKEMGLIKRFIEVSERRGLFVSEEEFFRKFGKLRKK